MASNALPLLFLLLLLLIRIDLFLKASASDVPTQSTGVSAFSCSDDSIKTCTSLLYQHNELNKEQIEFFYSVDARQISPITHGNKHNYLVSVPCSCKQVNGSDGLTVGYFYDASYTVRPNDTFVNVSSLIYSGQAWEVGGEERNYTVGNEVPVHLICGCVEDESQVIVTYTVRQYDTPLDIAVLLSSTIEGMEDLNSVLKQNPGYIDVGWVLFVPMEKNGVPGAPETPEKAATKGHKWRIFIGILSAVTLFSMSMLAIVLVMRRRNRRNIEEDPKAVSMTMSPRRTLPFQSQSLNKETMQDVIFEPERPIIYSLEEIEKATSGFDESKKIGVGGYGSVYFGILGDKEVAVKKMRSNKSKEFIAELKVLCRIHHINVVELLGYASGDDHLCLVYEFITNGSLSDHLHYPLLKGRQPLSWTARTQIALDAAKGIEYIHDHTKTQYVHRDIKTSNILLDEELRAKVADFGLAKLVGRASEDDLIATRLVGTPGYLPPESVKELQVTSKTDVFAFGVVLAELITGQRALICDNREPTRMKSLITLIREIFQDEDPGTALESIIDVNLHQSYPLEQAYKMAELAGWCLSEDAVNRPEMREAVVALSQIAVSSVEWEASLGGDSQVFSGVFIGR